MKLSIVIPCYNEAKRLGNSIKKIIDYLHSQQITAELILVDDGSNDSTSTDMVRYKKQYSNENIDIKIVSYSPNMGKGFAVKKGMLSSSGSVILICDADLSTPIDELDKLIYYYDKNYPIVIGSRKIDSAKVLKKQNFFRQFLGLSFSKIASIMLNANVHDFTCGFKLLGSIEAKNIAKRMRINRWAYDAEMIAISSALHYRIKEVGIVWINDTASRVKLSKDIFVSIVELLKISYNVATSKYESQS